MFGMRINNCNKLAHVCGTIWNILGGQACYDLSLPDICVWNLVQHNRIAAGCVQPFFKLYAFISQ
jgi:hypothetical protein